MFDTSEAGHEQGFCWLRALAIAPFGEKLQQNSHMTAWVLGHHLIILYQAGRKSRAYKIFKYATVNSYHCVFWNTAPDGLCEHSGPGKKFKQLDIGERKHLKYPKS